MNIRITTFSVLFAATCAISFNTAAQAGEDEESRVKPGGMRFDFGGNQYALDHVAPRHHYISTIPAPVNVHSGSAPKNLLGLDPGFLAKPAPLPVAPVAVAQPTVSAKPIIANNNPFSAVFGHPTNPSALNAPIANAGQFGKPAAAAPPIVAQLPQTHSARGVHGTVVHAPRPRAAAARPSAPIATYGPGGAYSPGNVLAGYGGGASVTTTLQGSVISHKH
jgi:hypothetical protein